MAIAKKKKRFFDVEIPLIKKTTQLQAYELEELEGKIIRYDLTRSLRGKSMLMEFKVSVKEHVASAEPISSKLMPYYLRRMVRKGTNYIEDSFNAKCKDAILIVKPLLISRRKISRIVRSALRDKAKEELINYMKDYPSKIIFDDLLKNQIQKQLSLKLKKIYPLSLCEIRILKIEKPKQ